MGSLVVITGPPGAGKSVVAREIADRLEKSAHVAGDDFFAFLGDSLIAPWLPEAHEQNAVIMEAAAQAAGRLAQGGYEVVYDGVVGPWFLDLFVEATQLPALDYAVLLPPLDLCLSRIASRTDQVFEDETAAVGMYRAFQAATIAERFVFVEPAESIGEVVGSIIDRRLSGSLVYALAGDQQP